MSRIWKRIKDTDDVFIQSDQVRNHTITDFKALYLSTISKRNGQLTLAQIARSSLLLQEPDYPYI